MTAKKCTKKRDVRAKLLFCLSNLLHFCCFLLKHLKSPCGRGIILYETIRAYSLKKKSSVGAARKVSPDWS